MKTLVIVISLGLLLAACGPGDLLPTQPVETAPVEPTTVVTSLPPEPSRPTSTPQSPTRGSDLAVEAAKQMLATQLGINTSEITLISVAETNWPDSCLGIPAQDEMCLMVITLGYAGQMEAMGEVFTFHTNADGSSVRILPAALLVARQALMQQTGLPLEQITLVSFEAVEWTDSCLGIVTPGVGCLDVMTPGYRIIFEANGGQYEYHTNRDGSQIVLASAPSLPAEGVLLTWTSSTEPCASVQVRRGQVDYGPCNSTLAAASFFTPRRAVELAYFVSLYAPFESQTLAGNVSLRGQGLVVATQAEMRMLAEWARIVNDEAQAGRGGAAWEVAFSWHRVGGIAGYCDELVVYLNGESIVASCRSGALQEIGRPRLDSLQLAQLYNLVDSLAAFEINQTDPVIADAMSIDLAFAGQGTGAADSAQQQALIDLAGELVSQAETPQDLDALAIAQQTLAYYLAALAQADYAGAAALYGGSYETMIAQNPGIDAADQAALFEAACTVNGAVCNLSLRSVVHAVALAPGIFRFTVELQNPDGALFEFGPCCGETPENTPPTTQFACRVELIDESYRVMTAPVYLP
jgi:hypothetical protein